MAFQFLLLSRFSRWLSQLSVNFGNWNGDLDNVITVDKTGLSQLRIDCSLGE
jgi:hypothetical protein